jgi:hypothetical protein
VGETVIDFHPLSFDPATPGPYTIAIGLYDPETGQRIPLLDAAGRPAGDHFSFDLETATFD